MGCSCASAAFGKIAHEDLYPPPVRVDADLRAAAESVLAEGESLSEFIETTVRSAVEHRRATAEFHARAEAAWQNYRRTGVAHPIEEAFGRIEAKIEARRKERFGG